MIYVNNFYASKIQLFNEYYQLCNKTNINYDNVKRAFVTKNSIPDEYLDVKPELRGFAGACFPKDIAAINHLMQKELGLPYKLWENIIEENERFKSTVFKGMRK